MKLSLAHKGFSLIEILVVMVFIAVMAGIVSSSMTKSLKNTKLRAASKNLVSALRYTRGQAVVKHADKSMTFDVEKKTYKAPRKKTVHIPKEMEMYVYTADSEIADETTGSIRFFSDGSSTGGWVKLVLGEKIWKVNVNWLTGEISVVEGTSS